MFKKALFISILLILLLSACASAASPMEPVRESFVESESMDQAAGAPPASSASFAFDNQAVVERLVIKNASLDIVVDRPNEAMDAIGRMAEEMGGYIVNANLYQSRLDSGVQVPRATITVRAPAERLDEALERIETLSNLPVENKTIDSQDVTGDYTDLQSRLRNLEAAETQLTRIMEEAIKTEDVLQVFNQLKQVREEIEVIKGQMQYYEQSARLSSISVNIAPNEAVEPLTIGGWQPVGIARDAVQSLINALQFLAKVGIWLILFIIPVLLVIFTPPFFIIRAFLRWRSRRKAQSQATAPQPES